MAHPVHYERHRPGQTTPYRLVQQQFSGRAQPALSESIPPRASRD
jgi:hypothetical protein